MANVPAVALVPGIYRIPTAPWSLVNSFAFVEDEGRITLVDTGTKAAPKKLVAALEWMGSAPSQVTRIVPAGCCAAATNTTPIDPGRGCARISPNRGGERWRQLRPGCGRRAWRGCWRRGRWPSWG